MLRSRAVKGPEHVFVGVAFQMNELVESKATSWAVRSLHACLAARTSHAPAVETGSFASQTTAPSGVCKLNPEPMRQLGDTVPLAGGYFVLGSFESHHVHQIVFVQRGVKRYTSRAGLPLHWIDIADIK